MPGGKQPHPGTASQLLPVAIIHRVTLGDRTFSVPRIVEGLRVIVTEVALFCGVTRILFLNPSRIAQHNSRQICRVGCQKNRAPVTLTPQTRQIPTMIKVCVRHDHSVQFLGGHGQVIPVTLAPLLRPLKKTGLE